MVFRNGRYAEFCRKKYLNINAVCADDLYTGGDTGEGTENGGVGGDDGGLSAYAKRSDLLIIDDGFEPPSWLSPGPMLLRQPDSVPVSVCFPLSSTKSQRLPSSTRMEIACPMLGNWLSWVA